MVASEENFKVIQSLIKNLTAAPTALPQPKVLELKYAEAGKVAATLNNLFRQRLRGGKAPIRPEEQVSITPDERINAIIVQASKEHLKLIEELVATLDKEDAAEVEVKISALLAAATTETGITVATTKVARMSCRNRNSRTEVSRMPIRMLTITSRTDSRM